MTCKGAVAKLSEYLDGELSGYDMLAIRNHLNSCLGCEQEFADLRQLKWMVSNLIDEQPDEDFSARLKTNVFAAAKAASRKTLPVAMMTSLAFTTAVLITLVALHAASSPTRVVMPQPSTAPAQSFDLARDQAYQSGGDPFSDGSLVITASNNASR